LNFELRTLNVEQEDALLRYLRSSGRIAPGETPCCKRLSGGVSNRTVLVERPGGEAWVLKQALPRLRVAEDWFSDPARVHREALGLRWLARLLPAGTVPAFVFEDETHHLLAMQAVPQPHENWKTRLLAGRVEADLVDQFGTLLALMHRRAYEQREALVSLFADRTFFETLRLEPYYRVAARRNPEAASFLESLIEETLANRLTLVHGDYSPKNLLVHRGQLVLLDPEVIHFGDPTFDVGFALTHLLSKARHLPQHRECFLQAAGGFWASYQAAAGQLAGLPGLESRAVRQTLGCLLARVDGRSPLEYLTPDQRRRQRETVLALMRQAPGRLTDLFEAFSGEMNP